MRCLVPSLPVSTAQRFRLVLLAVGPFLRGVAVRPSPLPTGSALGAYRNEKTYSEADLVEVLTASEDRVTPKCEYFSQCGGCQYQHMNISSQREWKTNQVTVILSWLSFSLIG